MLRAKRSLSQNFLMDPNLRRKLVAELGIEPGDSVLEVGPGHGELTELLIEQAAHVCLVEKDDRLVDVLRSRWEADPRVTIERGDALRTDLNALMGQHHPFRLISNVPYSITSPLLFRFLELSPVPRRIVVLVQKEVAERIVAAPGSRAYGALSIGVQSRGRARLAFGVGRQAFRPVPRVDSAAVVLDPDSTGQSQEDAEALRRLTRTAFGRRRKQMQKILRTAPEYLLSAAESSAVLLSLGLDPGSRPEELSPDDFRRLAALLEGK
ncbi:MAG: 16S rRNA (adenine(1518)-N(6)/adenine(1519)-N(6))-dimethyltransferase RsmA [Gemmatimonadota bacterium]